MIKDDNSVYLALNNELPSVVEGFIAWEGWKRLQETYRGRRVPE